MQTRSPWCDRSTPLARSTRSRHSRRQIASKSQERLRPRPAGRDKPVSFGENRQRPVRHSTAQMQSSNSQRGSLSRPFICFPGIQGRNVDFDDALVKCDAFILSSGETKQARLQKLEAGISELFDGRASHLAPLFDYGERAQVLLGAGGSEPARARSGRRGLLDIRYHHGRDEKREAEKSVDANRVATRIGHGGHFALRVLPAPTDLRGDERERTDAGRYTSPS